MKKLFTSLVMLVLVFNLLPAGNIVFAEDIRPRTELKSFSFNTGRNGNLNVGSLLGAGNNCSVVNVLVTDSTGAASTATGISANYPSYSWPFKIVEGGAEGPGDKALQMSYPALSGATTTLDGNNITYKTHYVQLGATTLGQNLPDIFVFEFKVKFAESSGNSLRLEFTGDTAAVSYNFNSSSAGEQYMMSARTNVGQWNTVKAIFSKADNMLNIMVNDCLVNTIDVANKGFWTDFKYVRIQHNNGSNGIVPTDNQAHAVYLDEVKLYQPLAPELSSLYLTGAMSAGSDVTTPYKLANLQSGLATANGNRIYFDTLNVIPTFLNPTSGAKNVRLVVAQYDNRGSGGPLLENVSVSPVYTIAGGTASTVQEPFVLSVMDNAAGSAVPREGRSIKVFALYDLDTIVPLDYARVMENGFFGFREE